MTLTSLGVQPTDRAVLSRCHADEPQPVHKAIASGIVMGRTMLAMIRELAKLNGFSDMRGANLFAACRIGNGAGDTE